MTRRPIHRPTRPAAHRARSRRPGTGSRRFSYGAAALGLVAVVALGGGGSAVAAPLGPLQTGPSGPTEVGAGSDRVDCLDQRLRPAASCPPVDADVAVEGDGDDLVVTVTNAGDRTWPGGPLAVEVPVPDADVDAPEGRADPTGRPGTPEWTTRAGTVVSRCVFEPVTEIRSGDHLTCRLRRLGLPDGEYDLWLTAFVGGLPRVRGSLGATEPALGVVAAATTRSVRVRIDGTHVEVVEGGASASAGSSGSATEAVSRSSRRTARLPYLLGATAVVGVTTVVVLRRRRPN
jgi:hypothetical protein